MTMTSPVPNLSARRVRLRRAAPLLLAIMATPLLAAPADQVRTRAAGYRQLGASFKAVNDALRASSPSLPQIRAGIGQIRVAALKQYGWFPAGSGPAPGVKTAARPEIWRQPAQFRKLQDRFAAQSQELERVAKSGDVAAIRTAARSMGASCKACHDQFREEAD